MPEIMFAEMCACPSPHATHLQTPCFPLFLCLYASLSCQLINWAHVRLNRNSGREYAAADLRWGTADPTVVTVEPVRRRAPYRLHRVKGDPTCYYWIIVLSTAELYGHSIPTVR